MGTLMQVVLWGIAPNEILEKRNDSMSLALIDAIELLSVIDRRNVFVAQVLQPEGGDYPFRVGYEENGNKEYWAGDSLQVAVQHLRDTMSPEGRAKRREMNVPMPGEAN